MKLQPAAAAFLRHIFERSRVRRIVVAGGQRWPEPVAFLIRIILSQWADTTSLRQRPASALVRLFGDTRAASIMLGRPLQGVEAETLIRVVESRDLVGPCARVLVLHQPTDSSLSLTLHDLVVFSAAEIGPWALQTCLLAASRSPASMSSAHATGILRRCMIQAAQPIDPYKPPGIPHLARRCAAAILEVHPELDPVVEGKVQRGERGVGPNLEIFAAAIRGRTEGQGEAVGRILSVWSPSEVDALTFAASCDSRSEVIEVDLDRRPPRLRVIHNRASVLSAASTVCVPGVVIAIAVFGSWGRFSLDAVPRVDVGAVFGLVGILVAVHVLSAELAASRLPGIVARYTAFPRSLLWAYLSVGSLLVCAIARDESTGSARRAAIAASGAGLLLLLASTLALMIGIVRRTDPANAAASLAARRENAYYRSGQRLGRAQQRSVDDRALVSTLPAVRVSTTLARTEQRAIVRSPKHGIYQLNERRMRRLAASAETEGFAIRLVGTFGTIVDTGDELAAVVPSRSSFLRRSQLQAAKRAIRVVRPGRTEEVAEAVAELVGLAMAHANRGDLGGAGRIGDAVLLILRSHLYGLRSAREASKDALPVVPALRTFGTQIPAHLQGARAGISAEFLVTLVERVLTLCEPAEMASAMFLSSLDDQISGATTSRLAHLYRVIGIHAVASGDRIAIDTFQRSLRGRCDPALTGSSDAIETWSEVCAQAVWLDYNFAARMWTRFVVGTVAWKESPLRLLHMVRIGAAALDASVLSVALKAALDVGRVVPMRSVRSLATGDSAMARFRLLSDLGGGYLGSSPEDAIVAFLDLAEVADEATT